ncbi:MAG: iron(III) transport system substrate-binding protein [Chthoniobacter sp.]|jgi:ABC-type Fe3+ transport system substrate-binding protein|nr:iron(III) transport system substrate-binding protein [Chthoniobacter sp.]
MLKQTPLFLLLLVVLLGPIALRPKELGGGRVAASSERTLVLITPHNESIRYEFSRAFEEHYLRKTGQRVRLDWRTPGGTSEIGRYVASEYLAAFQDYWVHKLHRKWGGTVAASFDNPKVALDDTPADDTPEQQARRAFLDSSVGCKIDLFFGGGAFDFAQQSNAGRIVDSGFVREHPELFNPQVIPQTVGGEPYWDPKGRWIGTVVSSFGICYNVDSLRRLGIAQPPMQWAALADPHYRRQIALANPTQSSSVNKSFEMVIQQRIQQQFAEAAIADSTQSAAQQEDHHVREGWVQAMRLLMKIGANARYFTDASTKISLDVEAGEAAAGMTIDFYGRFQSEAVRKPDGSSRLQYANVVGGSSVGVDPIAVFRGAPHPDVAKEFIAFVMSPEGQKLWNWKVGIPGGPRRYALRRLPVLPQLYAPEFQPFRSDPEVNPYELARTFTYHDAWTARLFRPIAFIFRVMCIDPHDELTEAWQALVAANFPPQASEAFEEVNAVDYAAASGSIRDALSGDKIKEVQLAKDLADRFRAQYRRAARLAREGD